MHITVTGKQIDVGEALRQHVEAVLQDIADKYFGNAIEAHVVLSRDAHLICTDVQVHVGRGIVVRSQGDAMEAYASFDSATGRLSKRLRRYKRRLRDHHIRVKEKLREDQPGRTYILRAQDDNLADDEETAGAAYPATDLDSHPAKDGADQPIVIAEMDTPIPHLSVSEAVMRLDLADLPALLFFNGAREVLNVVYRRRDGNIGWIDPGLNGAGNGSRV